MGAVLNDGNARLRDQRDDGPDRTGRAKGMQHQDGLGSRRNAPPNRLRGDVQRRFINVGGNDIGPESLYQRDQFAQGVGRNDYLVAAPKPQVLEYGGHSAATGAYRDRVGHAHKFPHTSLPGVNSPIVVDGRLRQPPPEIIPFPAVGMHPPPRDHRSSSLK